MNAISQEITVDLVDQNGWAEVKAKQNDNRVRHLLISLTNKGLSYSIPAGIKIRFQGTKSDGKTFKNDCVALDNKIDVELTEQILAVDGVTMCEIELSDSTGLIKSANFAIKVIAESLKRSSVISTNEYKSIDAIEQQTLIYKNAAEAAKDAAQVAKIVAETAAQTAATTAAKLAAEETRPQIKTIVQTETAEPINKANTATTAANNATGLANAAAQACQGIVVGQNTMIDPVQKVSYKMGVNNGNIYLEEV